MIIIIMIIIINNIILFLNYYYYIYIHIRTVAPPKKIDHVTKM